MLKIARVMTDNVKSCTADMNLAAVTQLLWEHDCGVIAASAHAGSPKRDQIVDTLGHLCAHVHDPPPTDAGRLIWFLRPA